MVPARSGRLKWEEYLTLGQRDEFVFNLLLPMTITFVFIPAVRTQSSAIRNYSAAVVLAILLLGLSIVAVNFMLKKTYSPELHRRRSLVVSVVLYSLLSLVLSLLLFAIVTWLGGTSALSRPVRSVSVVLLSTGVFLLALVTNVRRDIIHETYDNRPRFENAARALVRLLTAIEEQDVGHEIDPRKVLEGEFDDLDEMYGYLLDTTEELAEVFVPARVRDEREIRTLLDRWNREFAAVSDPAQRGVVVRGRDLDGNVSGRFKSLHEDLLTLRSGLEATR
jgi:hypothetical protein